MCRFATGLFEGAELNGKDLTEKADRMNFLEKLISHTQGVLGETFAVRCLAQLLLGRGEGCCPHGVPPPCIALAG